MSSSPENESRLDYVYVAASLLAFVAFNAIAPALRDVGDIARPILLVFVSVPLMTLPICAAAPAYRHGARLLAVSVAAGGLALVTVGSRDAAIATMLAKLVAATSIGFVLGRMVTCRANVFVIASAVALIDVYSVMRGPTFAMVATDSSVVQDFTLGLHVADSRLVARIGVADLLFFGFFMTACLRFGLRRWGSWAAMTASIGASLLLAERFDVPMPALPLMSAALVAVNVDRLGHRT